MNDKKKIIIVAAAFHPVLSPRSFRAIELSKELARRGHEVLVVTRHRDFDYETLGRDWKMEVERMSPSRLPKFENYRNRVFSLFSRIVTRILVLLFEYPNIELMFKVNRVLKKKSDYDMLITIAVPYPVHWGAALARKKRHRIATTWVADCGDPYFNTLDSFKRPFYFRYIDRWYCKKPDYISIPHEGAREGYLPEVRNKIRIIPQGFNFNLEDTLKADPENPVPTFAYAGGFIPGSRDPGPLFQYLSKLDMSFRFLLFTKHAHMIQKYNPFRKGELEISDYIPREKLMEILKTMDFVINIDNNAAVFSPSKLIDYAITGRPILNIDKNFSGEELLAFLKGDYSNRMIIEGLDKYHISNVATRFLELNVGG